MLLYAVLLTLLVGLAMAYYELVLPYLAAARLGFSPSRQDLSLALLALGLLGDVFLGSLFAERDGSFDDIWWQASGPLILLGISLGVTVYAISTIPPLDRLPLTI